MDYENAFAELSDNFDGRQHSDFVYVKEEKKTDDVIKATLTFTVVNTSGKAILVALNTASIPVDRAVIPVLNGADYEVAMPGGGVVVVDPANTPAMLMDAISRLERYRDVDIILNDGLNGGVVYVDGADANKKVVITTDDNVSVDDFRSFVARNFATLHSIDINANDAKVFQGKLYVKEISPFADRGERQLKFSNFQSAQNLNDKIVKIVPQKHGMSIQFDDQTLILVSIPGVNSENQPYVEATMTLNFSRIYNPAYTAFLQSKRAKQPKKVLVKKPLPRKKTVVKK